MCTFYNERKEIVKELYSRLMELCRQKGISGYKLCKDLGIQPSFLTDLKAGRQKGVSAGNAAAIATYFGVPLNYVLFGEEEKEKKPHKTAELSFIEKELLRCWNAATDVERQTIATLLSPYGMPYPTTKTGAYPLECAT